MSSKENFLENFLFSRYSVMVDWRTGFVTLELRMLLAGSSDHRYGIQFPKYVPGMIAEIETSFNYLAGSDPLEKLPVICNMKSHSTNDGLLSILNPKNGVLIPFHGDE